MQRLTQRMSRLGLKGWMGSPSHENILPRDRDVVFRWLWLCLRLVTRAACSLSKTSIWCKGRRSANIHVTEMPEASRRPAYGILPLMKRSISKELFSVCVLPLGQKKLLPNQSYPELCTQTN